MYDLTIDGILYHGSLEYVSSHFEDGNNVKLEISKSQNKTIKSFVDEYLITKKYEPSITIEEFYKRKTI